MTACWALRRKWHKYAGIMHNKEVQAAIWAPSKSFVRSGFVPHLDKGWGGSSPRAIGGCTTRGRAKLVSRSPGALPPPGGARSPGRPGWTSPSLPASSPPAARGRRRLPGARLAAPERQRGSEAGAGQAAAMDRFVWTSGLLEINETLVIQQRGVRIYDGEEKVGRRPGLAPQPPARLSAPPPPAGARPALGSGPTLERLPGTRWVAAPPARERLLRAARRARAERGAVWKPGFSAPIAADGRRAGRFRPRREAPGPALANRAWLRRWDLGAPGGLPAVAAGAAGGRLWKDLERRCQPLLGTPRPKALRGFLGGRG